MESSPNVAQKSRVRVALGLGGNQGSVVRNFAEALRLLRGSGSLSIERVSSLYRTRPIGEIEQEPYTNAVVVGYTDRSPLELLRQLKAVETQCGRTSDRRRNAPRPLDLDILFYGDSVFKSEPLTLPHPRMAERGFVLEPLSEICPTWKHPILDQACSSLLERWRESERGRHDWVHKQKDSDQWFDI